MRIIRLFYLDAKMLLRSKEVIFWSIVFPPIMLLIMGFLFPEKGLGVEEERYVQFLTPGIIGLTIMMGSLTGTPARLVRYRQRGMFLRLTLTPFTSTKFLFMEMSISMCFVLAQSVILLILGQVFFCIEGIPIAQFLAASFAGIIIFTALGGAIAGFTRTTEGADALANLIATPMMFLCGVFFSIAQLPNNIQKLTELLPLTQVLNLMRNGFKACGSITWIVLAAWVCIGLVFVMVGLNIDKIRTKRG